MTYGTILPNSQDKRKKNKGLLAFDNGRQIYLNSKERQEFDAWVNSRVMGGKLLIHIQTGD